MDIVTLKFNIKHSINYICCLSVFLSTFMPTMNCILEIMLKHKMKTTFIIIKKIYKQ